MAFWTLAATSHTAITSRVLPSSPYRCPIAAPTYRVPPICSLSLSLFLTLVPLDRYRKLRAPNRQRRFRNPRDARLIERRRDRDAWRYYRYTLPLPPARWRKSSSARSGDSPDIRAPRSDYLSISRCESAMRAFSFAISPADQIERVAAQRESTRFRRFRPEPNKLFFSLLPVDDAG